MNALVHHLLDDVVGNRIADKYRNSASSIDESDGISMEFETWRFNLRASNTEPVIRLNVESRADTALMKDKTSELLALLDTLG